MTKQDIIRMAQEAGDADRIDPFTKDGDWVILTPDELERFAVLVASAEREACAKLLEDTADGAKKVEPNGFVWQAIQKSAELIRARAQA